MGDINSLNLLVYFFVLIVYIVLASRSIAIATFISAKNDIDRLFSYWAKSQYLKPVFFSIFTCCPDI